MSSLNHADQKQLNKILGNLEKKSHNQNITSPVNSRLLKHSLSNIKEEDVMMLSRSDSSEVADTQIRRKVSELII